MHGRIHNIIFTFSYEYPFFRVWGGGCGLLAGASCPYVLPRPVCFFFSSLLRLQTATDALSRYDQIIVTARIVLMFDGSSGQSQAIREAVPLFQQVYEIIRSKCPQWHEGNVQLMGVYLAITFLEYGLNSQTLGVDGQRFDLQEIYIHAYTHCNISFLGALPPLYLLERQDWTILTFVSLFCFLSCVCVFTWGTESTNTITCLSADCSIALIA